MPRNVQTTVALTQLPKGEGFETQRVEAAGTTVLLTDREYARIPSALFTGGQLVDLGYVANPGDGVTIQGTHVNLVGTLTGPVAAGSNPTKAEHDALVADLATIRTALNATLTALSGTGKAMS